jgi:hypothetical protein
MVCRFILPALLIAAVAMPVRSESVSLIKVQSEPAAVEVAPQAAGRRLVRLPALEFSTLTLPRQQTAPLAVVDFCQIEDGQEQGSQELLVRDAFTAHLSLRCTGDEQLSVVYASQSLDVALLCKPADQDPSADSATR